MIDVHGVVTEYIKAVGDRRYERVEQLLHPEATVGGMVPRELRGRDQFLAALRRLAPILARNEIRRVFVGGDEAVVIYDLVSDTPVGAVLSAEWLIVKDGLIRSSILLFDQRRWPEVLSEIQRRASSAAGG